MKQEITITKTHQSRLNEVDFDNIPFGRVFSDHMFIADYKDGQWHNPRIVPFGPFPIHPAAMALHYGQEIFEGMKATKRRDGTPLLFRPEMHAQRLNRSAERMCMPPFPEDLFLEALHLLVGLDHEWIPPKEGSALYIRPIMFANDEFIGVKPSLTYRFIIFTGPVGPYYPKPVRLLAETKYIRAALGGTGEAKAAGNYGGALLPARLAQEKGFDQVMWLDAREFRYIQEVGTMNIFFVIGDKVITPATSGTILKGITRDSILKILRDNGYDVEERPITIDEVVEAHKNGTLKEAFGSGTAAVVAHVEAIQYKDYLMELPPIEERKVGEFAKDTINGIRAGRIEDKWGWCQPVSPVTTIMHV
ncbi:MAG: branched-chain amino acid aminotransferase [Bacteroidetes bacterium]|nr:MAG: branched-chain amino acid aminotransferase [Bacteroidota bacterium]